MYQRMMEIRTMGRVGGPPIVQFGEVDAAGVFFPHSDALMVCATVANIDVQRVLVDTGSSADILLLVPWSTGLVS